MNPILESVQAFLSNAGFEVTKLEAAPFALVGQNDHVIVFGVDVGDDLSSSARLTVSYLSRPFRSKSFGPKTMEMYVVFASTGAVALEESERVERDTRVCRKIVLTSETDLEARLSFLRPLDEFLERMLDPEAMFWQYLAERLDHQGIAFLRDLVVTRLTIDDIKDRMSKKR